MHHQPAPDLTTAQIAASLRHANSPIPAFNDTARALLETSSMGRAALTEFDRSIPRATIRPEAPKSRRGFIRANLLVGFCLLAGLIIAHIAAAGPIARLEADRAHAAAAYCGRC